MAIPAVANMLCPWLTGQNLALFFLVIVALAIALVLTYDLGRKGGP